MISRIEKCDHWEDWDDCYECADKFWMDTNPDFGHSIFIYLHSLTATKEENIVTGWPYRAERPY